MPVSGDRYVWSGPTSGSWASAANWTDTTTGQHPAPTPPTANDFVTIPSLGVLNGVPQYQTITGSGASASLTIGAYAYLNGTFQTGSLAILGPASNDSELDLSGGSLAVTHDVTVGAFGGLIYSIGEAVTIGGSTAANLRATDGGSVQVGGSTDHNIFFSADSASWIEIGTAGGVQAGTVQIDAGAVLNHLGGAAPTIINHGTMAGGGFNAVNVTNTGSISGASFSTYHTGSAPPAHLTVTNSGTITLIGNTIEGSLVNNGTLVAGQDPDGYHNIVQDISGTGQIQIGAGGDLQTGQVSSGQTISFQGTGDSLTIGASSLDSSKTFDALLSGFSSGDTIDYAGTITSAVYNPSNGILRLQNGGALVARLHLAGSHSGESFQAVAVSGGGTAISIAGGPTINGASGPDTLNGGAGDDTLNGLAGDDTLNGAGGDDTLDGGTGNDALIGGAGVNTATYFDATAAVTVSLQVTAAQDTGGAGTDTLSQIQNLTGSAYGDTLTAGTTGSVLRGLGGNDVLVSGPGNDTLDGGTGYDTAVFSGAFASYTVTPSTVTGLDGTDTLTNVEILRFTDRQMVFGSHNGTLTARAGGDTLVGSSGDDVFVVGTGADAIDGGAGGNDDDAVYFSGNYASYTVNRNSGVVTVTGSDGTDTLTNIEKLHFADQTVLVSSLISAPGQTITGTNGNDTLNGTAGDDTISGLPGSDILNGLGGHDILNGNGGADVLNGGAGQDNLAGGAGADTFVFSALSDTAVAHSDLITDFTSGQDRIDVSAIDPNFHLGSAAAAHTIVVTYDAAHDRTVVDLYVSSSLGAEIWLSGNHNLSAGDFVL